MDDVKKRDLRAELLAAEADARARKRKAEGKPLEDIAPVAAIEDEEVNKRRKLMQQALEMDKDDDSDDNSGSDNGEAKEKEKEHERYVSFVTTLDNVWLTLCFLKSAKRKTPMRKTTLRSYCVNWKRSKERGQRRKNGWSGSRMRVQMQSERHRLRPQTHYSTWLLHSGRRRVSTQQLQGRSPSNGDGTTVCSDIDFCDWVSMLTMCGLDLIFKNQAMDSKGRDKSGFVNDLLRTEFHKYVSVTNFYMLKLNTLPENSCRDSSNDACRTLYASSQFFMFYNIYHIPVPITIPPTIDPIPSPPSPTLAYQSRMFPDWSYT